MKNKVGFLMKALKDEYGNVKCALHFENPYQLLIATILSAQCTDKAVNIITPLLFSKYPDAKAMSEAKQSEIERIIHSTGFFRNKAKAIIDASKTILNNFNGEVPKTMNELITLKGVARKTANVVLGIAFGKASGIVVDTHVKRLSYRLGLSNKKDVKEIEKDLMNLFPKEVWIDAGLYLTHHGRVFCTAKSPKCNKCPLNNPCPKRMEK